MPAARPFPPQINRIVSVRQLRARNRNHCSDISFFRSSVFPALFVYLTLTDFPAVASSFIVFLIRRRLSIKSPGDSFRIGHCTKSVDRIANGDILARKFGPETSNAVLAERRNAAETLSHK